MKRVLRSLCCILLAAVVLVSCDPGPAGIFSMLEEEEPLNKGTDILNDKTASFVLRYGTDYYTAIGKTLLRRPAAGGSWEAVVVDGAPENTDGIIYVISSAVVYGGDLYISYAPGNASIFRYNGTIWESYVAAGFSGLPEPAAPDPTEPVQSLLVANGNLFAATQSSDGTSTSSYTTYYSLYHLSGTVFSVSGTLLDLTCGLPSSIAYDTSNSLYWITAGNTIFTGSNPASLAEDTVNVAATTINTEYPVMDVYFDSVNNVVMAAACGKIYQLESGGYTASGTFGSTARRLSSIVEVPSNEGGNAIVVGVKPWSSDSYLGYYEYDAALNASFGSGVTPDTDYTLVSDNSNYVTTLDDLGIEGFFYDGTGQVLFARAVMGGLWSNSWDGSSWSGWDRE